MQAPAQPLAAAAKPEHVPDARVHDFDLYAPADPGADLFDVYKALQESAAPDIFWTPRNGGHWMAKRGDYVLDILKDHERFSSRFVMVPKARNSGRTAIPIMLDPPDHGPYRALLSHAFSIRSIAEMKPDIRRFTVELVDGLAARGACDFVRDFALMFPIGVFLRLVDLPMEHREDLLAVVQRVVHPGPDDLKAEPTRPLADYLAPIVAARRAQPGSDLISQLGQGQVFDRPLTYDEHLNMCVLLLIGGLDSVANTLGFFARFLADNPAHRRQLVAEPELVSRAVEELLRRFPTVAALCRTAKLDMDYGGAPIRAGDIVVCPTNQANLDPRLFPDPMRVDFARRPNIGTFGSGPHKCPGAALARMELGLFLEEWLRRIPDFEVAPGAEIVFKPGINIAYRSLPLVWEAAA